MTEQDTKGKILTTATQLFARNGFDGSSIREIAAVAGVNLSAVNYHFKNKENLYISVFKNNHQWLDEQICLISRDDKLDLRSFVWEVFSFLLDNGTAVMNTFKIFLHEGIQITAADLDMKPDEVGPPGQEVFLKKINSEVGEEIALEKRILAVEIIFSHIVHKSICMSTSFIKEHCEQVQSFSEQELKDTINFLVDSNVEHLKSLAVK
jgi:AcrR family transcriptional regulator